MTGSVKMMICTRDRISYQTCDEGQGAANNCVGTIAVNQASGKCNSDRAPGDAYFRFRLLRQQVAKVVRAQPSPRSAVGCPSWSAM